MQREVTRLSGCGLIRGRRVGRSRLVSANPASRYTRPLIELVSLVFGPQFVTGEEFSALGAAAVQATPAAAGGIALAATNLRQSTRRLAQAQQAAPAAYLLSVREALTPQTWLTQILAIMRRASGVRS